MLVHFNLNFFVLRKVLVFSNFVHHQFRIFFFHIFQSECLKSIANLLCLHRLVSEVPTILPKVSRDILETMSPFVRQADFSLDWMQMEAGKSVYRQGDRSEATYLVINGRLR